MAVLVKITLRPFVLACLSVLFCQAALAAPAKPGKPFHFTGKEKELTCAWSAESKKAACVYPAVADGGGDLSMYAVFDLAKMTTVKEGGLGFGGFGTPMKIDGKALAALHASMGKGPLVQAKVEAGKFTQKGSTVTVDISGRSKQIALSSDPCCCEKPTVLVATLPEVKVAIFFVVSSNKSQGNPEKPCFVVDEDTIAPLYHFELMGL